MLRIAQLLVGALSFVVAVNLAILVYARTVTRLGEIAVRTALGASRRRILAQLFIEALALSVVGAAAGLVLADIALGRIAVAGPRKWQRAVLDRFRTVGGNRDLRARIGRGCGRDHGRAAGPQGDGPTHEANLRELNGRTGARLGPMWTTLVVAQVAVAVAVLPVAVLRGWQVARMEIAGPGFAAEKFVVGTGRVERRELRR